MSLLKNKEQEFIRKCYNFSKKNISIEEEEGQLYPINNDEYLPIPLSIELEHTTHRILLLETINDLRALCKGYNAHNNTKIKLKVTATDKNINTSLAPEVFSQIVISTFLNLLYFNKDTSNQKYIKLVFKGNKFICSSDGFLLDSNLMIKFSKKIFHDTGNPYLLSMGQVFALLKSHQLFLEAFL